MTTSPEFEPELVEALNLLIEDERASVEMEVALASGATEYAERDALSRMGVEDIATCETLRAEMEGAGLAVTPQINGVVFEVLGAERYDDRLRAFAHHQRIVADRANDLLESNLDGVLREALETVVDTHERHGGWASIRADEFAATRLLEFGSRKELESMEARDTDEVASMGATPALDVAPATEVAEVAEAHAVVEDAPELDVAWDVAPQASDAEQEPDGARGLTVGSAQPEPGGQAAAPPVRRPRATAPKSATPRTSVGRKPTTPKAPARPRTPKPATGAPSEKKPAARRKPAPPAGE